MRHRALRLLLHELPSLASLPGRWNMTVAHLAASRGDAASLHLAVVADVDACTRVDVFGRSVSDVARAGAAGSSHDVAVDVCSGRDADGDDRHVVDGPSREPTEDTRCRGAKATGARAAASKLGWQWLSASSLASAGVDLPALLSHPEVRCVRDVDAAAVDADVAWVEREAESVAVPVIVRGGVRWSGDAAAPLHFSRQQLLRRHGRSIVAVANAPYADLYGGNVTRMPLQQFVDDHMPLHGSHASSSSSSSSSLSSSSSSPPSSSASSPTVESPPYVFDSQLLMRDRSLLRGVSFLNSSVHEAGATVTLKQLALGPALSGSPPHFHPPAWNALLFGRKLWLLVPPADAVFVGDTPVLQWFLRELLPTLAANASVAVDAGATTIGVRGGSGVWIGVQNPGDLVFVPEFWGHAVLNLADSLAFAREWFQ
jgi:hypothetical protein